MAMPDAVAPLHTYGDPEAQAVMPRVLAMYFPQFHQDPLNDRLWGIGFTDWDNLREAPTKNRRGHPLAHPTEFGYYDLKDATIRQRQGTLARQSGVDGFVYHHY